MSNNQPQEGNATVAVEKKTSKIPSMVYLCAGLSALAASACMMCRGRKSTALLVMGLYNKLVKTEGHDGSATKSPIKPTH